MQKASPVGTQEFSTCQSVTQNINIFYLVKKNYHVIKYLSVSFFYHSHLLSLFHPFNPIFPEISTSSLIKIEFLFGQSTDSLAEINCHRKKWSTVVDSVLFFIVSLQAENLLLDENFNIKIAGRKNGELYCLKKRNNTYYDDDDDDEYLHHC